MRITKQELLTLITSVITEEPDLVDGISTKEWVEIIEAKLGLKPTTQSVIKALKELTNGDGYDAGDRYYVMGEGGNFINEETKPPSKYYWFFT